jgi:hypothetical protein
MKVCPCLKHSLVIAQAVARARDVARDDAVCCPRETFKMKNRLLTPSMSKLRYNVVAILKTYELFIYTGVSYVSN